MALTCGPGLSAAEGAAVVEAGSAAAARCWAKGAAAVAGLAPCGPRETGVGCWAGEAGRKQRRKKELS